MRITQQHLRRNVNEPRIHATPFFFPSPYQRHSWRRSKSDGTRKNTRYHLAHVPTHAHEHTDITFESHLSVRLRSSVSLFGLTKTGCHAPITRVVRVCSPQVNRGCQGQSADGYRRYSMGGSNPKVAQYTSDKGVVSASYRERALLSDASEVAPGAPAARVRVVM